MNRVRLSLVVLFAASLFAAPSLQGACLAEKIAAKHAIRGTNDWYGCRRTVFDFDGYEAWVVEPPEGVQLAAGHPWTWTMQWASAFVKRTSVPRLVREYGWRHATIITFKDKMDAHGLDVSRRFQQYLVEDLGFAPKTHLIGMSWGGFFSIRYAAHFPENVAKIYLDCPLMKFQSNITGAGSGWDLNPPAGGNWADDPRMPINLCTKVAAAKIPVLLLYGATDATLPPCEHAEPFIRRFQAAGGNLKVVKRTSYGHHPHGVELDENTIVDFFVR